MCCFSRAVAEVAETNLFARASGERQFLVYQMQLVTVDDEPLAMILPLPVPARSAEDALRFVDLSGYPTFFDDLRRPFAAAASETRAGGGEAELDLALEPLAVVAVGRFVASFVPTLADFARLDTRFRFDPAVWQALPQYADWGFAVFMLDALSSSSRTTVHPMAFEFPRRDPSTLFFPTVHIHDGRVHDAARFEHNLFFQDAREEPVLTIGAWGKRAGSAFAPAREHASPLNARGILDAELPVQVVRVAGALPNHDALIGAFAEDGELAAWQRAPQALPAAQAVALVGRLLATPATLVDYLPSGRQRPTGLWSSAVNSLSPEACRGEPTDERSDVYAVAALLHHLASGELLFGTGMPALVGHLQAAPPRLADAALDAIVQRGLAKDPAARYPTLAALAAALTTGTT